MKTYIGIDNGVTGSIAILSPGEEPRFFLTPTRKEQDYTKAKQEIRRILVSRLVEILTLVRPNISFALLERPMINPTRWRASVSAIRADEATRAVLEMFDIAYSWVDSKEWQKEFLPKGTSAEDLKVKSREVGRRLFPACLGMIENHGDADGLFIAEYARRKNL